MSNGRLVLSLALTRLMEFSNQYLQDEIIKNYGFGEYQKLLEGRDYANYYLHHFYMEEVDVQDHYILLYPDYFEDANDDSLINKSIDAFETNTQKYSEADRRLIYCEFMRRKINIPESISQYYLRNFLSNDAIYL